MTQFICCRTAGIPYTFDKGKPSAGADLSTDLSTISKIAVCRIRKIAFVCKFIASAGVVVMGLDMGKLIEYASVQIITSLYIDYA